jgi:hypothetical protein
MAMQPSFQGLKSAHLLPARYLDAALTAGKSMFSAVSSAFARCVIITSGDAEPWIFERFTPLLALADALASAQLLRCWQQLLLRLRRIDELARYEDDALRVDAFGDRLAIAEIKGEGRCRPSFRAISVAPPCYIL